MCRVQARDAGVEVCQLCGGVYAEYAKLDKVPTGGTLSKSKNSLVVDGTVKNPLVCVVTKEQASVEYRRDGRVLEVRSRVLRARRVGVLVAGGDGHVL